MPTDPTTDQAHRPRVLILNHFSGLGGAEFSLLHWVNDLSDTFDIRLAVPGPGLMIDELHRRSVPVFDEPMAAARIPYHRLQHVRGVLTMLRGFVRYTRQLRREFRDWDPELIYANSLKSGIYGQALAIVSRRPWVWHIHDRLEPGYLSRTAVRLLKALAVVGPRAIIVPANGSWPLLPKRAQRKAVVLAYTVDIDQFAAIAEARHPRRDGPLNVAVIARLTPVKGQHLVIDALARARSTHDLRLVLIGGDFTPEGAQVDRLTAHAEAMGVGAFVQLTGHINDVADRLLDIDMVVSFPTHAETFGQGFVQAMAAKLPVITADEGGPADIVEHDVSGLIVRSRDVDALAAAMCRLADDPALRDRLAEAARQTALDYSPDLVRDELVELLMRARR